MAKKSRQEQQADDKGLSRMGPIEKEYLGLAGEYAVANELCLRGYYAQLTLRGHKGTDILVEHNNRLVRIQVKTKQGWGWPGVWSVPDDGTVLVLVDYENKVPGERPVFYILTSVERNYFIKHDLADAVATRRFRVDESNVPVYLNKKGEDVRRGISLRTEDVSRHKERWDRVEKMLGDKKL